jgi:hypothetical protein
MVVFIFFLCGFEYATRFSLTMNLDEKFLVLLGKEKKKAKQGNGALTH